MNEVLANPAGRQHLGTGLTVALEARWMLPSAAQVAPFTVQVGGEVAGESALASELLCRSGNRRYMEHRGHE